MSSVTLSNLKPARGSQHRRKLLGRGEGSGHGQTSTRGMKGQRSRSGDTRMMGFEGGQVPLFRRLPKRGFNNTRFQQEYAIVNVEQLERFFSSGDKVGPEELYKAGAVRKKNIPIKLLGKGSLSKKLTVTVNWVSASAKQIVEKVGGSVELAQK